MSGYPRRAVEGSVIELVPAEDVLTRAVIGALDVLAMSGCGESWAVREDVQVAVQVWCANPECPECGASRRARSERTDARGPQAPALGSSRRPPDALAAATHPDTPDRGTSGR